MIITQLNVIILSIVTLSTRYSGVTHLVRNNVSAGSPINLLKLVSSAVSAYNIQLIRPSHCSVYTHTNFQGFWVLLETLVGLVNTSVNTIFTKLGFLSATGILILVTSTFISLILSTCIVTWSLSHVVEVQIS